MPRENVVVAALENPEADWEESLEEMERLVDTANGRVVAIVKQRRNKPEPATYLGKGKVEETKAIIEEHEAQLLVVDGELAPSQQRNLERLLDVQVIDRTGIILDIFARRANTAEGKLQVELAQMEYLLPRLTNLWSHLSRIKRGIGMRGPGETQLEVDRRRVRERIAELSQKVKAIREWRAVQRRQRAESQIPMVSLVSYTNAGKSTLLNALSGADVFVEDKLFATLDPTTRDVNFPNGMRALVSDTVGFIRNLPHQLVAAFRATLEEVQSAEVLVHVIDAGNPGWVEQEETVDRVLAELEAADKPTIMAFNKIDTVEEPELLEHLASRYPHVVFLSAKKGVGITELEEMITAVLRERWHAVDTFLPLSSGDLVAELHARGEVAEEDYQATGVHLIGKAPADLAARIAWRAAKG